jgi:hypothetical protein
VLALFSGISGRGVDVPIKPYPLLTWSNQTCRAKGRFKDREYCASAVIDQIVADGKSAIPVLFSQVTDSRLIQQPAMISGRVSRSGNWPW